MPRKLTEKGFWGRIAAAERLAELHGARFEDDTREKQLTRMAEAVVLPERFNQTYLPHYFRSAPAPFHLELYRALEQATRIAVRAPRGHAKSTVITFAYTLHQVVCGGVLRAWVEGRLQDEDPALHAAMVEVIAEEEARRAEAHQQEQEQVVVTGIATASAGNRDVSSTVDRGPAPRPVDHPANTPLSGAWEETVGGGLALYPEGYIVDGPQPVRLHWDPYIQVIAVTLATAVEFTESVKVELESNELLRSDWGDQVQRAGVNYADFVAKTGVRVRAFGMDVAIRGGKHGAWRPTLAILDDPDSERTVGTDRVRNKQQAKVTAAINYGLEPPRQEGQDKPAEGRVFLVGTPLHWDALACRFTDSERFKRWLKLRYRALPQRAGVSMEVLWPSRWTPQGLADEELEDPEAFGSEMDDTPPNEGQRPFKTLLTYSREDHVGKLSTIMVVDPALGKTRKSDLQAVLVGRITRKGTVLVHRAEGLRIGDPVAFVEELHRIYEEEQPDLAAMETIGFQELLAVLSETSSKTSGLLVGWHRIPYQDEGKDLRIRSLAPLTRNGTILFPSDGSCRALERTLLGYPEGKVDLADGLEMLVRLARQFSRGGNAASRIRHVPREARFEHARGGAGRRRGW